MRPRPPSKRVPYPLCAALFLLLAGCSSNGTTKRDSSSDDAPGKEDAGGDVAPPTDEGPGPDVAGDTAISPPAAPTITKPAADAEVYASIDVAGTGESAALIEVQVLSGTDELGRQSTTADAAGSFALTVLYSGAADGDQLTVSVTQTTAGGTSPAATVSVKHSAPLTLSGKISQSAGSTEGVAVVVRLYASKAPEDLLDHADEVVLPATAGVPLAATAFSFKVGDGTYYLRAFRDAVGPARPFGVEPDGEPTLEGDPQAVVREVVMGGTDATDQDLDLVERTNTSDHYGYLDARTRNESAVPHGPSYTDNGEKKFGKGLCGGYYLALAANLSGSATSLTAPLVRLPDGKVITLLDDGGCGEAVHDNSSSSYDFEASDNSLSYGIADPATSLAGDYALFYEQTQDGFVHIERDTLSTVVKLPLLREFVAPDGTQVVDEIKPTIDFKPVSGAAFYEVNVQQQGGGYDNFTDLTRQVTSASYTPATDLNDDACYSVRIRAYDADLNGADVDAESEGSRHFFCIDTAADSSITVSGNVANKTGHSAPVVILALTDSGRKHLSTVRVAAGATTYSVGVLAGDGPKSGVLSAFVDVAGSGDESSPENRGAAKSVAGLDLQASATQDLTFNPEVLLDSPADGDTAASLQPTFSWKDYAATAGANKPSGAFSYGLYFSKQPTSGFPTSLLALPDSATSFDLANPPAAHLDLAALLSCMSSGGTFSLDASGAPACSGGTMSPSPMSLEPNEVYNWGLAVMECDFAEFNPPTDVSGYLSCVQGLLSTQQFFAMSVQRTLHSP